MKTLEEKFNILISVFEERYLLAAKIAAQPLNPVLEFKPLLLGFEDFRVQILNNSSRLHKLLIKHGALNIEMLITDPQNNRLPEREVAGGH